MITFSDITNALAGSALAALIIFAVIVGIKLYYRRKAVSTGDSTLADGCQRDRTLAAGQNRFSKFEKLRGKITKYEILQDIAKRYRDMIALIDSEKGYFRVEGFSYSARSDVQDFDINSYYAPIPAEVIREGLQAAVDEMDKKIEKLKEELEEWL